MFHISQSTIASVQTCEMMGTLKYVHGYEQFGVGARSTELGSLVHVGLETWLQTRDKEAAISSVVSKAKAHNHPAIGAILSMASATVAGYCAKWKRNDEQWVKVETEVPFSFRLSDIVDGADERVIIQGKIDAILTDKDGGTTLMEHKTSKAVNGAYLSSAQMDLQVGTYVMAMQAMGRSVDCIIYDTIQKSAIKQKKGESLKEYAERCVSTMAERDRYQRTVLPGDDWWFKRVGKNVLQPVTKRIVELAEGATPAMNLNSCSSQYGRPCHFISVCGARNPEMVLAHDFSRTRRTLSSPVEDSNPPSVDSQSSQD